MTYEESIVYLESFTSFGIKPGLHRISKLLEILGNPQNAYKTIHVTGTNGKGSVATYVFEVIRASGLSCGRFTSPHLQSYTERIRVNTSDIEEKTFGEVLEKVKMAVEVMINSGEESPTQFEILTAAAFLHFKNIGVDYAVIEVGLGGLLDSTNVITPEVAIITNVTIDHTAYCGTTVDSIAEHKAGIIKKHVPIVTGASSDALAVITKVAVEKEAPLYLEGVDFTLVEREQKSYGQMVGISVSKPNDRGVNIKKIWELFLPLFGEHQGHNAAIALMALLVLSERENSITEASILNGFKHAQWPGRFEVLPSNERIFIFDGAHNAAGAKAFANTYKERYNDRPKTIVMAILQDKDVDSIIDEIVGSDDLVVTVPAPTPRTMNPLDLADKMPCSHYAKPTVSEGVIWAYRMTPPGGIIVICGSLYILGEAKEIVRAMDI